MSKVRRGLSPRMLWLACQYANGMDASGQLDAIARRAKYEAQFADMLAGSPATTHGPSLRERAGS